MASYNDIDGAGTNLPQSKGSTEEWVDALILDFARNGDTKGRRLAGVKKKAFKVEHKFLTAAQKALLETFYDTNRKNTFDFTWNDGGSTYTVIFADNRGLQWRRSSPLHWDISVELREA